MLYFTGQIVLQLYVVFFVDTGEGIPKVSVDRVATTTAERKLPPRSLICSKLPKLATRKEEQEG